MNSKSEIRRIGITMGFDKICTILVGPAGSGKSTLCRTEFGLCTRISQDDMGKSEHRVEFANALLRGEHIIVDRMNFSREQRARYIEPARAAGYGIRIVVLHLPRDICMLRMAGRFTHNYGESPIHPTIRSVDQATSALDTFFTRYERPTPDEADVIEFRGHGSADSSNQKPECIIVDLDGTLCVTDHRQKYMETKPKDWKSFFAEIPNDTLNHAVAAIVRQFSSEGYERDWDDLVLHSADIVLCSGRPDEYREVTKEWLDSHKIPYSNLFMRARNDFRRDDIVKEIILDFEILPRYRVLFALDDRQQVVDMWRRRGITCMQVAPGDF